MNRTTRWILFFPVGVGASLIFVGLINAGFNAYWGNPRVVPGLGEESTLAFFAARQGRDGCRATEKLTIHGRSIAFYPVRVYTRHNRSSFAEGAMRTAARQSVTLLLITGLLASPAIAGPSINESATRAARAAADAQAPPAIKQVQRGRLITGIMVAGAGGAAIILGTTAFRTEDTTSGNAPAGAYASCVALKTNPVYRGNDCDALKGPNKAAVIGGAIAAASGVALMMSATAHDSVSIGATRLVYRHRFSF